MVKSLVLCEGGEDVGFLKKVTDYLGLDKQRIEFQKMGGKSSFFNEDSFKIIKRQIELDQFHKILFIVDVDYKKDDAMYGGLENTKRELENIIKILGFQDISKCYFMCDPITNEGNLEHLVLSTISDKQKACIIKLLECIDDMEVHGNKKIVLTLYKEIFKESPYNLDHENFSELKELLLGVYT